MKEQIARSVFWIMWSKGGLQLISMMSTLVVAHLLTPSDYGVMALATALVFPMSLVAEMGLSSAILQYRDLTEQEMNLIFWTVITIAVLLYCALCLFAPAIGAWFSTPQVVPVLAVAGLALPATALRVIPDSLLRKKLALDKVAQAELIASTIVIPTTLILAMAGVGVWALVVGFVLLPLVQTIMTFQFYRWKPTFEVGTTRTWTILNYSASTLGAKVCWATYRQADLFILGKVSGDVALGVYSFAKQLAMLPSEKISTVVNQLAWPVMAHLQNDREQMAASLMRSIRLVACLTLPICAVLLLTSEDLVTVVLTDKWKDSVPVIQVLCGYGAIRSIDVMLPPVLLARFRQRFLFLYTAALTLVMPLAFYVCAQVAGPVGVASVWILLYPAMMMMIAREALKEVGIAWRNLWKNVWPILVATVAMAAIIVLVQQVLSKGVGAAIAIELGLTVLAGCVAYCTALFCLDGEMLREVREIVSWMLVPRARGRVQEQAT